MLIEESPSPFMGLEQLLHRHSHSRLIQTGTIQKGRVLGSVVDVMSSAFKKISRSLMGHLAESGTTQIGGIHV
jgi:hypothetical protein